MKLPGIKPAVISAPFGNWLAYSGATSTVGTFTREYRGGLLYRLWRMVRTLRYLRRPQAWLNRLGLPNQGIASAPYYLRGKILSVHGFNSLDWDLLSEAVPGRGPSAVELNLSCPNVGHKVAIAEVETATKSLLSGIVPVIAKLPPVRWMDWVRPLHALGVRAFHATNTMPSPGGGLSGKPLKQYALWAVEEIKAVYGDSVCVIGGGGITDAADVDDYVKVGADHVAIASVLLNPFAGRRVRRIIERAKELLGRRSCGSFASCIGSE